MTTPFGPSLPVNFDSQEDLRKYLSTLSKDELLDTATIAFFDARTAWATHESAMTQLHVSEMTKGNVSDITGEKESGGTKTRDLAKRVASLEQLLVLSHQKSSASIADLTGQIASEKLEKSKMQSESDAMMASLKATIEMLGKENAEKDDLLEGRAAEKAAKDKEISALSSELQALTSLRDDLQAQLSKKEEEIRTRLQELEAKNAEKATRDEEISKLSSTVEQATSEVVWLRETLSSKEKEIGSQKELLLRANEDLSRLQKDLEVLHLEIRKKEEQLTAAQEAKEEATAALQGKIDGLIVQRQMDRTIITAEEKTIRELKEVVARLQKKNTHLRERLLIVPSEDAQVTEMVAKVTSPAQDNPEEHL